MHKEKITVLSTYLETDKEAGAAKRINGITKNLPEHFDVARINVSSTKNPGAAGPNNGEKHADIHKPSAMQKTLGLLGIPYPLQQHYSSKSWKLPENAEKAIREPEILQVEFPYIFEFAKKNAGAGKIVLSEHNFELEHIGGAVQKNLLAGAICRKVGEIEKKAAAEADKIITATEDDKEKICRRYGTEKRKVIVCPNGADTKAITPAEKGEKDRLKKSFGIPLEKKVAIFCGSNYGPNNDAAAFICNTLAKTAPDNIAFMIVGETGKMQVRGKNIFLTGYVESIAPYLKAADIALNPTNGSGGSNIKMFEYMAAGLPIVSTESGARGIDRKKGVMITARLENFSEQVNRLAEDENRCARLGRKARKAAELNYDWAKISEKLARQYKKLLK